MSVPSRVHLLLRKPVRPTVEVDLRSMLITDVDLVLRKAVRPTVEVDLRSMLITDADVKALCASLDRAQPTALLMSGNIIDEGGKHLAASLQGWRRLERLEIKDGCMTFASVHEIARSVKRNPMIQTLAIDLQFLSKEEKRRVKAKCLVRTWVSTFNGKNGRYTKRNAEKHRVLALMSASRRRCNLSVERFLARDGDHAVCTRVLKFLMPKHTA